MKKSSGVAAIPRKKYDGQRFNRLLILKDAPDKVLPSGRVTRMVECQCDCGKKHTTYLHCVKAGVASSCGCLRNELSSSRNSTHGMVGTPEYETWHAMCKRARGTCDRKRYFDRGIGICPEWATSFETFYRDMGDRPSASHSIDRVDNSKGYSPENCKWSTIREQNRNKTNTLTVEFRGQTRTLSELSEEFGLTHSSVRGRLRLGWTPERIFTTPIKRMKQRTINEQYTRHH